jgi:glycosyltransferase involved in cell wall biosynthesis
MRILIVAAGRFTNQIGGGQSYTQDLALGLKNRGHSVVVLEFSGESFTGVDQVSLWNEIPVWSVKVSGAKDSKSDYYSELGISRVDFFVKILEEIDPEYIQINNLIPGMVRACNRLGLRHFVVAHHPGEICPKGDLLTSSDKICTVSPTPKICGKCILDSKKQAWGLGRVLSYIPMCFYRALGEKLVVSNPFGYVGRVLSMPWIVENKLIGIMAYLNEAQMVVAPSKAIAVSLMRSNVLYSNHLKVITHGIHKLQRTKLTGLETRPVRLGYIGRIDYAKGLHILLAAMKQENLVGRAELHIFGEATNGTAKKYWDELLKKYAQEPWLHIHGSFKRNAIQIIVNQIDVLVLPAIYLEVFGLVVAESLSAGRPVLTTACGGPEEQIVDGLNGWIVPPNDITALGNKIRSLVNEPGKIMIAAAYKSDVKTHAQYLNDLEQEFFQEKR